MRGAGPVPARDRWRFVPMAGWIRSYQRAWLKDDLIAGFAVAALIVPKNLGYAGIAGIPLQNGLYAAAAGGPLLGREPGTQAFRELDEQAGDEQFPGTVVLRLDGGLFFATSDALEDRVREVALSTTGITGIVLDCEGIDFIDSQGSAKMREILELTEQAGVILRLARVKPAVCEALERDGVLDRIGDDETQGNVDQAVGAQIPAEGGTRAGA